MEEIEVKFLDINPIKIQKKLEEIGAKKVGEYFQKWISFDYPDLRLEKEGAWIRLREEGNGKITLAFKKRLGMKSHDGSANDDGMEEIETLVDDFDKVALIFERMGFAAKHYAEKKRIHWEKDDIEFDVDIYPELEPFLEIESNSWEKVNLGIKMLDLNPDDKKIFTGTQMFAMKGIDVGKIKRITFKEGLVEK